MNNPIKSWFKKNFKYILVIIIYFLYLDGFLFLVLNEYGININSFPKMIRIICYAASDLLYVVTLLLMFKKEIINGIKDLKKNFLDRSFLAVNCWIVGCIIMTVSSILISFFAKQGISENEKIVRESIKLAPIYMLFTCSVVAPILEEMVFRRSMAGFIKNKWIYILISGLSFGLLHVIGNNPSALDYLYVVPYGAMGCSFAYLYYKTKNISLPMIVHMIHNTILVIVQIIGG